MTPISNELFQACQKWATAPGERRSINATIDSLSMETKILAYDYPTRHCTIVNEVADLPTEEECRKRGRERLKRELEALEK